MLCFALLIASSFSVGGLATRELAPTALQAIRYLIAAIVLLPLVVLTARQNLSRPAEPMRFVVLGFLMAVYMVTMFVALRFTKPVATGAVFTLMPLLSAGFAWLLIRQRTRLGVLTALSIAAIGAVWVIFQGDIDALLSFSVGRGELIYFVGVICHAAYVPLLRLFNRGEPPAIFMLWSVLATLLFIAIAAVPDLAAVDLTAIPWTVWAAAAYLAIATTVTTFFLLQYASLRLPAPKVLAYGYLTPTFIIVLEGLIGHGWASASVFAGALVTACGLVAMAALPD